MSQTANPQNQSGTWVLMCFIAFFGVIIAVNAVFITTALTTHSGVVTEQPYEKGRAFNETLEKAKTQPVMRDEIIFQNDTLQWRLIDASGKPVTDARITALMVRPVKGGHDFQTTLSHRQNGLYEAELSLPLKGRWTVKLSAEWNKQNYQTTTTIIAK